MLVLLLYADHKLSSKHSWKQWNYCSLHGTTPKIKMKEGYNPLGRKEVKIGNEMKEWNCHRFQHNVFWIYDNIRHLQHAKYYYAITLRIKNTLYRQVSLNMYPIVILLRVKNFVSLFYISLSVFSLSFYLYS